MLKKIRKLVVAILLLIVPVQGLALGLDAFVCEVGHEEIVATDTPDHHASARVVTITDDQGHGANDHSAHSCCHPAWAAFESTGVSQPLFAEARISTAVVKAALFVPEQPQRPPPTS